MSKNWIQKATKNMRKDKPCTGEKFGSESCPPGSKRYNLAKTFRKMAKEGHKLASLERASVLSASDDPKDQDKAREIRVRHDYENLKKQIGSKKRPTKPAVNEGDVHSGQGEKIQKRTKAWMDKKGMKGAPGLDAMKARTAEHKAKRGVKEEVEIDETVAGGVPLTPQELEIQKKMSRLNVRLAKKRSQQMQKAKINDTETAPEQVKEEDKAFKYVVDKLRKQHGKDAVITKTSKPKPPSEAQKKKAAAERKKRQDADNKAYAARAKKAGFKSTQDYTDVVARYGSEDNYRKGKGLGT